VDVQNLGVVKALCIDNWRFSIARSEGKRKEKKKRVKLAKFVYLVFSV
jgi:hypothetical protein